MCCQKDKRTKYVGAKLTPKPCQLIFLLYFIFYFRENKGEKNSNHKDRSCHQVCNDPSDVLSTYTVLSVTCRPRSSVELLSFGTSRVTSYSQAFSQYLFPPKVVKDSGDEIAFDTSDSERSAPRWRLENHATTYSQSASVAARSLSYSVYIRR